MNKEYFLFVNGKKIKVSDRRLKISENVMRHMIIKKDEK